MQALYNTIKHGTELLDVDAILHGGEVLLRRFGENTQEELQIINKLVATSQQYQRLQEEREILAQTKRKKIVRISNDKGIDIAVSDADIQEQISVFDDEIKEFMTSPMTSKHKNSILLINQDLHELEIVYPETIYNINCIGCRSEHSNNSQTSLEIKKVNRMSFEGYIDGKIVHNGFVVRDVNLKVQSPYGNRDKLIDYDIINNNTDFPRLELKNMYENSIKIQNTQTTIIKGLLGGNFNSGDILTLIIDDNFTSIKNDSNLILKKALYSNKGTWIKLKYNGDKWEEIEHFENGATTQQIDLTSVSNITSSYTNTLDILIPNTTTNKIKRQDNFNQIINQL